MTVTPWWEHLNLREEIKDAQGRIADVAMSLFRTTYKPDSVLYSTPDYYSAITYPTTGLVELLAKSAVRLGLPEATSVPDVWRGDQAMGGGKSHGLVGLYHLASDPAAFRSTELGSLVWEQAKAIAGTDVPTDLGDPIVVVLACDELDPAHYHSEYDGIAETLAERWLWRVMEEDTKKFKKWRDKVNTKDGITEIIESTGRPVLTLIDEILDYVQKATLDGESKAGTEVASFCRNLFEATKRTSTAETVVVMISSETDRVALSSAGEAVREQLEGDLSKHAIVTTTTTGTDFARIIRRRLFTDEPDPAVLKATAAAFSDTVSKSPPGTWADMHGQFDWWKGGAFQNAVERTYPFHPDLMGMIEREWANQAGFQKVRSTIQIFAATVWVQAQRAADSKWVPLLIGLGDVPLSDSTTRESITNSGIVSDQVSQANWREVAGSDIASQDDNGGAARLLDLNRNPDLFTEKNPRVAERMATAIFLTSLTPRAKGKVGATDAEVLTAGFVPEPECTLPVVQSVLQDLEDDHSGLATLEIIPGTGGTPRRLRLSTRQTVAMLIRQQRNAITDADRDERIRDLCRNTHFTNSGPFDKIEFVTAEDIPAELLKTKGQELTEALIKCLGDAQIDTATTTRLFVCDPYGFTLMNGQDSETRQALSAALGVSAPPGHSGWWPPAMSVAWPSSMVFAVVNTQRRSGLRSAVADLLAIERVSTFEAITNDDANKRLVADRLKDAEETAKRRVQSAFQHIVFLNEGKPDADGNRPKAAEDKKIPVDDHTALDGSHVWSYLAEAGRAYRKDELDKDALVHLLNTRNAWATPLKTLRDNFYKVHRVPLLWSGEASLQRAIFEAIEAEEAELRTSKGEAIPVQDDSEVNLSTTNELHKPSAGDIEIPDLSGLTVDAAKAELDQLGLTATLTGTGATVTSQDPSPGTTVAAGSSLEITADSSPTAGGGPTPGSSGSAATEQTLTVTSTGIALTNPDVAEAVYMLFTKLANLVDTADDGSASHLMLNMQITGTTEEVQEILSLAEDIGFNTNVKDT